MALRPWKWNADFYDCHDFYYKFFSRLHIKSKYDYFDGA